MAEDQIVCARMHARMALRHAQRQQSPLAVCSPISGDSEDDIMHNKTLMCIGSCIHVSLSLCTYMYIHTYAYMCMLFIDVCICITLSVGMRVCACLCVRLCVYTSCVVRA